MIGDVVGKLGRQTLTRLLPAIREEQNLDFVVANGENAAGGFGLSARTANDIFAAGVDVITSGNHIWDQNDIYTYLTTDAPVLRPLNYSAQLPGRGWIVVRDRANAPIGVLNLQGVVLMPQHLDNPFEAADRVLGSREAIKPLAMPIVVDFHAETTAEKGAMAWYLAGRVSAVVGTHTHVATADPRIIKGTAFVTDLGMTGPRDSVIGSDPETAIRHLLLQTPGQRNVVVSGVAMLNAVVIETDPQTHLAVSITRLDRFIELPTCVWYNRSRATPKSSVRRSTSHYGTFLPRPRPHPD